MWGPPRRSRFTRIGPDRPIPSRVPETSATSGGGSARPNADAARVRNDKAAKTATVDPSLRALRALHSRLPAMAIKDGLLADYDHEMGTTRKLLERLPDDKLSWKPHAKSMSLGGLATHLSNIPIWGGTILTD